MPEPKDSPSSYPSRQKGPSPLGSTLFIGLRAADVLLQYNLLNRGLGASLISRLGGNTLPLTTAGGQWGLHPYSTIMSTLALGSAAKQILWQADISEQVMYPGLALAVCALNTTLNSINTLLSLWDKTSNVPAPTSTSFKDQILSASPSFLIGLGLYAVGLTTELAAEYQRKWFKQDPKNKGKPYGGGLFGVARNVNYGAYVLWRTGYGFIAGGFPAGLAVGGFFFWDFVTRGVPVMNKYCEERYGEDWEEVKKQVPWKLIPGIY